MSRRRESSNPVALFPFLAVLMSAMGALILLLLVISNKVHEQKESAFRAAVSQEPPPLPKLPDKIKLDPLAPLPEYKQQKSIELKLPDLPPLVDKRKDAKKKLDELKKQHAKLDAEANKKPEDDLGLSEVARAVAAMKVKLQDLKVQRQKALDAADAKKREIDKLKGEKRQIAWDEKHVENKFAVVPYTGPNGTKRRPIFLECTGSAITLQPEGVAITPEIMQKPADPRNPLAEMCRALIKEMSIDGPEGVPYPLLIVRPDGTSAYYGAQLALSDLNLPFGYELISEDMKLEYPEPDPKLKAIALAAIDKAQKQRERPWSSYAYGNGSGMGDLGGDSDDPEGAGPGGNGPSAGGSNGQSRNGSNGGAQGNGRGYDNSGPQPGGPELGLLARRYAEQQQAGPARRMRAGQGLQPHNGQSGGYGNGYGGSNGGYGASGGQSGSPGGYPGSDSSGIPPPPSYIHEGHAGGAGGGRPLLGVGNFGQGGGPIIPGVDIADNGGSGNGSSGGIVGGNGSSQNGEPHGPNGTGGSGPGAPGGNRQGMPGGYGQGGNGTGAPGGRGQGMAGGNPQGMAGGQPGMPGEAGWGEGGPGRNGQSGAGGTGAVGRPGMSGGDGWSSESGDGTGASGLASGSQNGTPGGFGGSPGANSNSNARGNSFAGMGGGQPGSSSQSGQPSNGYPGSGQAGGSEGGVAEGAPGMANSGSPGQSAGLSMGEGSSGAEQPGQGLPISISMGNPSNGAASDKKMTFDDVMQQSNGRQTKLPAEHDPDLFELNSAMDGGGRGEVSVPGLRINRQPVRREVVVECRQFGLILHPGKVFVPLITDNDLRPAASSIYRHAANQLRGAGSPGPLHRWNPVIAVYVRPDGVENYYRTRMALLNSELDMIRKNVDWETPLEFTERFVSRPNEATANQPSRTISR